MARADWIVTALLACFTVGASAAPKFADASGAVDSTAALGWPLDDLKLIGAMPMTALLGGAIASHLRAGSPLFSHTLFGVYLGVFMWAVLLLDRQLRDYLGQTLAGSR